MLELSRRSFIAGLATAILNDSASAAGRGPIGQTLIGGFSPNQYPFKNFLKYTGVLQPKESFPFPAVLNAEGYPIATLKSSLHAAVYLPEKYAGRWIVKWSGAGKMQFIASNSSSVIVHSGGQFVHQQMDDRITVEGTSPRVELSFASPTPSIEIVFDRTGDFSRMGNAGLIRSSGIYATDEAALDGDVLEESFNEDFISQLRELNARVIRPMGWTNPNGGNNVSQARYRVPVTAFSFGNQTWQPGAWVGAIEGGDTYRSESAPDTQKTWTDREVIQGYFLKTNVSQKPTLNVHNRGEKKITDIRGNPLQPSVIEPGSPVTLVYDALLDALIYTRGGLTTHIPLEVQVALANKLDVDFWYTFPHLLDDASIAEIAKYVRDHLRDSRAAYFEYSNEIWNSASPFPQTAWAANCGLALGFPDREDRHINGYYGLRVRQIMGIVTELWKDRTRLRRVMAFQAFGFVAPEATSSGIALYRLEGRDLTARRNSRYAVKIRAEYNRSPNRPIDYCDVLSYATYYSGAQCCNFQKNYKNPIADLLKAADDFASGEQPRQAAALDFLDRDIRRGTRGGVLGNETLQYLRELIYPAWEKVAAKYDKLVECYEGGCEIVAPTDKTLISLGHSEEYSKTVQNLIEAYKNDERFEKLVVDQFQQFLTQPHSRLCAWLILHGRNQWGARTGDLYSAAYRSWDAMKTFNSR